MFFIIFSMFIVFSIIMLIGSPKKSFFYISFDYSHYTYRELLRRFYIAARGVLF